MPRVGAMPVARSGLASATAQRHLPTLEALRPVRSICARPREAAPAPGP